MTKKIIAIILIICMVTILGTNETFAKIEDGNSKIVYVDGIKIKITEEGENIIITTEEQSVKTKMILDSEGNASVYTYNEYGEEETLKVKIYELTEENVKIVITREDGEIIQYNSIEDLEADEYIGQTTAVIGLGYTALYVTGIIISALLVSATLYYIRGVAYRALDYALQKAKIAANSFYMAYRYNRIVLVSKAPISFGKAVAMVRSGQDVYTFYKLNAYAVVSGACMGVKGPEMDSKFTASGILKKGIYYKHYHTNPKNGSHIFFGPAHVYA